MLMKNVSESGQTFLEFILLLLMLVSLSFILLKGINTSIAKRWESLVEVISYPTDETVRVK